MNGCHQRQWQYILSRQVFEALQLPCDASRMLAPAIRRAPAVCTRQERRSGTCARFSCPPPVHISGCNPQPASIWRSRCARTSEAVAGVDATALYSTTRGAPAPLGPSPTSTGINFALASVHATDVRLCLFDSANHAVGEYSMYKSGAELHSMEQCCRCVTSVYYRANSRFEPHTCTQIAQICCRGCLACGSDKLSSN